jgi:hypothetical protein
MENQFFQQNLAIFLKTLRNIELKFLKKRTMCGFQRK